MQWTPAAIRRHRVLRGWSQDDAARELGVSRRSISSWESGEARPQGRHADALDRVFGAPPADEPNLSQFSDAQLVLELARRLAEKGSADPALPTQDLEWPRGTEPDTGHAGRSGR